MLCPSPASSTCSSTQSACWHLGPWSKSFRRDQGQGPGAGGAETLLGRAREAGRPGHPPLACCDGAASAWRGCRKPGGRGLPPAAHRSLLRHRMLLWSSNQWPRPGPIVGAEQGTQDTASSPICPQHARGSLTPAPGGSRPGRALPVCPAGTGDGLLRCHQSWRVTRSLPWWHPHTSHTHLETLPLVAPGREDRLSWTGTVLPGLGMCKPHWPPQPRLRH